MFCFKQGRRCSQTAHRWLFQFALVVLLLAGTALAAQAGSKVLCVNSYGPGFIWSDEIIKGVQKKLPSDAELKIFNMNTKEYPGAEHAARMGQKASDLVASWNPDVVIASSDAAQEYFARRYVGKKRPAIIFTGVNNNPKVYGYPAANVTGVLARPHIAGSLEQLQMLIPRVKRVAVFTDTSETSSAFIKNMKAEELPVTVVSTVRPATFAEWKSQVQAIKGKVDAILVLLYHTVLESGDKSAAPRDVMQWTVDNSALPVVGVIRAAVEDGALLAVANSGQEQGRAAAKLTSKILAGQEAGNLPYVLPQRGYLCLNSGTASKLGVKPSAGFMKKVQLVVGRKATFGIESKKGRKTSSGSNLKIKNDFQTNIVIEK